MPLRDNGRNIRKPADLSVLLAVAAALYAVERQFLGAPIYPGVKLGLANSVTMMVLVLHGPREGLAFSVARVILGSLITGTLGSVSFLLSMSGALLSALIMSGTLFMGKKKLTLAGVGALGGASHNLGQLLVYSVLTGQGLIFGYGPKLMIFGSISGFILGSIIQALMNRLWAISTGDGRIISDHHQSTLS